MRIPTIALVAFICAPAATILAIPTPVPETQDCKALISEPPPNGLIVGVQHDGDYNLICYAPTVRALSYNLDPHQ